MTACVCSSSGVPGRAEGHGAVLRRQGPEEGRGADGRRRGVHPSGAEGAVPGLGAPLPHPPLLHLPDQGDTLYTVYGIYI